MAGAEPAREPESTQPIWVEELAAAAGEADATAWLDLEQLATELRRPRGTPAAPDPPDITALPSPPVTELDFLRAELFSMSRAVVARVVELLSPMLSRTDERVEALAEDVAKLRTSIDDLAQYAGDPAAAGAVGRLDDELAVLRAALVDLKNERADRHELIRAANQMMDLRLEGWARNLTDVKALLARLLDERGEQRGDQRGEQ